MLRIIDRDTNQPAPSGFRSGPDVVRRLCVERFSIAGHCIWRPMKIAVVPALNVDNWTIMRIGVTHDAHVPRAVNITETIVMARPRALRDLLANPVPLPAVRVGDDFWIEVRYEGGEDFGRFDADLRAAVAR